MFHPTKAEKTGKTGEKSSHLLPELITLSSFDTHLQFVSASFVPNPRMFVFSLYKKTFYPLSTVILSLYTLISWTPVALVASLPFGGLPAAWLYARLALAGGQLPLHLLLNFHRWSPKPTGPPTKNQRLLARPIVTRFITACDLALACIIPVQLVFTNYIRNNLPALFPTELTALTLWSLVLASRLYIRLLSPKDYPKTFWVIDADYPKGTSTRR